MQGDQADILFRLKQVLPLQWFPDSTPVLDTVLSGVAYAWAWVYQALQVVECQARISTAQGIWLDLIAEDFFGSLLSRRIGESDAAYCTRIKLELVRERGTRAAALSVLSDLTGRSPQIFEPANTADTGGYGSRSGGGGGFGYGISGGWGSLALPLQFFLTAYRPVGQGIATVPGWGCSAGGYGEGSLEYADLSMMQGQITDADISAAVVSVLPVGTTAWLRISN